jgi:hypothetical protein
MRYWIPIQGTGGVSFKEDKDAKQWWHPFSPFSLYLNLRGLDQFKSPEGRFEWSSDLDFIGSAGRDWEAGAKALTYYLQTVPIECRNILAHSHGGQVAILAAQDIVLNNLVLVSTPVREGLLNEVKNVKVLGNKLHVYSKHFDVVQLLGSMFDGHVGFPRYYEGFSPVAIPRVGHSGLLRNPKFFPNLVEFNLLEQLGSIGHLQMRLNLDQSSH